MALARLLTIAAMTASLHLILRSSNGAIIPAQLSIPNHNATIATAYNTSLPILLSTNGSFTWQFVPYKNDTLRLLVILSTLYNTTVVWIANRDNPVSANATLDLIYPDRRIVLQDRISTNTYVNGTSGNSTTNESSSSSEIWSSPGGIYSVLMNTTGNLVMLDNSSSILWQSYDYPTDVLLA